ncbi:hypothetical protein [Frankia sp. Cas3]|uniref:hypothetical protein n=1 Tax=Frankia sp. Cas3 TaxID=3073926 RepID=UPI002AD2BFB1|nr:hypothetical protein [Frankia sp. Cas3]
MGIGLSLAVFALGAILGFAVSADPSGLDITTVGLIFMLVGAIGFGVTLYRERWRRHIVEESMEAGTAPPVMFEGDAILDWRPEPPQPEVVVHENMIVSADRRDRETRTTPSRAEAVDGQRPVQGFVDGVR